MRELVGRPLDLLSHARGLGAEIQQCGPLLATPPDFGQPHDRNAWVHYKMGDYPALGVSLDNDTVIPYYSWLAKTYTFCDHHFGAGSDSTPGHMLAVGGQMPTLKNPPFGIDNAWHSHASIPKTIIDLFGLSPIGIPRVDTAPSLVGRIVHTLSRPTPPAFGSAVTQPATPSPPLRPIAPPPWTGPSQQVLPPLVANGGENIPAPTDGTANPKPPKVPVH